MNIRNLTALLALLALISPVRAGVYDAVTGFDVKQGVNNWKYYWRAPKAVEGDDSVPDEPLQEMTASDKGSWMAPDGAGRLGSVSRNYWQPGDEGAVIRAFTVPQDGEITIAARGNVLMKGYENSEAQVRVMKNEQQLWPEQGWTTLRSDASSVAFPRTKIEVKQGDEILFCARRAPDSDLFNLFWGPVVAYGSGKIGTGAPSAIAASNTAKALRMCWIWDNRMVLQADRPVPVWGKAEPGESVTVAFAGQEKTAKADEQGDWSLKLDPLAVSAQGRTLEMKTESEQLVFQDVLVGDVWVCSGQSNMAQPEMRDSTGAEKELEQPTNDLARAYNVTYNLWAAEPQLDNFPAKGKTTNWFFWKPLWARSPAVPYYFGQKLQRETGRPIGLILVPLGASTAEAWVPQAVLERDPLFAEYVATSRGYAKNLDEKWAEHQQKVADWKQRKAEAEAKGEKFTERKPWTGLDPQFWPRWWAGSLYNSHIAPLRNMAVKGVIWYQGEQNAAGHGGSISTVDGYVRLMQLLIQSWREQFEQPELPFYQVQLSMFGWNHYSRANQPGGWSVIREAQEIVAESVPHSGIAISVDVGDKGNIHPPNKRPVGERLARLALRDVYGKDVIADGPAYAGHEIDDGKIRIRFKNLHGGLKIGEREGVDSDTLIGFAIAGADRTFVWADARIEGDEVVVSSEQVPEPVAVRYAYVQYHDVNLYNAAGLPAAPFRTDDWPLREQKKDKQ